jgi:hypothetical protein
MRDGNGTKSRRPQSRKPPKDGWTKARRQVFLNTLAACGHVRRSAEAAGLSATGAYQLRRRDGAFALLWAEALEMGYQRLEDELLALALVQIAGPDNPDGVDGDPPEGAAGPFDPELAMAILKMRTPRVPGRGAKAQPRATQDEVDAELMRRLDMLAESLGNTA